MNPSSQRRSVITLRTVGRGFWIGLGASVALHALLITTGRFSFPSWKEVPPLEARLEPEAFKTVSPPAPTPASAPVSTAHAQPQSKSNPGTPAPELPIPQPAAKAEEPAPAPPPSPAQPEPVLPLSTAKTPPPSAQPYAALTQAAQKIRDLPAHIEIVYELNGMLSGRQSHVWQRSGQNYTLEATGEITGLAGLFVSGKLIQKSRGRIGELGLMPDKYEMERVSGKKEILRFDYDSNVIEFSRPESKRGVRTLEMPLLPGAQDPLSSIYQLAMAAQDGKSGFIVAASGKRVKGYPYRTLGPEKIKTALGEIKTLHVTRAGDSEKGGVHLWLAPEQYALPVKVTYVDEDGTEWVLEAVSIKTQ
jgi:hypothetical protein